MENSSRRRHLKKQSLNLVNIPNVGELTTYFKEPKIEIVQVKHSNHKIQMLKSIIDFKNRKII
jgi:hypothetical protein